MKKIVMMGWFCLIGLAFVSQAAEIAINSSAAGNVDWNASIWGDPATVPTGGNDYVHDGSSAAVLLGLGTTYGGFAGDSLTMDAGTVFYSKGGGSIGSTLYMNGCQWQTRSAGTATVLGNIRVTANSTVLLIDGNLQWNTGLSSTSNAVLTLQNFNKSGKSMVVNASDSGFFGTFDIKDSGNAAYTWTIQFDQSYSDATLKIEGQKNDATYAAVYQLTGDIEFKEVMMPNGSGGLVVLDPGSYDAAALAAAGVSSDYYNDLGGTIRVATPPASEGIEMNAGTPAGTNIGWNDAIWGSPAETPTNGNDYVYNVAGVWLNALGLTYGAFDGDSVRVKSGSSLFVRGGGSLGGRLILDGGQFQNRSGINAVILGNIQVDSQSTILNISGNLELRTSLEGDGQLNIQAYQTDGQRVVIQSTDLGYAGKFALLNSGKDDVHLAVQFNRNFTEATLAFQGGNLSRATVYQLTNDIAFLSVSMPSAADESVMISLDPGVYDGAALAAAGVNPAYYSDQGGTISVGLSAYERWDAGWGIDIGAEDEDYDGDGLSNLAEYALGGDPTDSADLGEASGFANKGDAMLYVYAQYKHDTNLVYYLQTADDLMLNNWTNSGYTVLGTNVVSGGDFNFVTNSVPMTKDETFVRLVIEK
ncbi:hypothetical protein [Tichowtungia aerotolerans]|uniref:Uncharacterized protein n=1 Tax=Tichowtungia aerotolerans TaxID=2697043 RepID=A0A6P1M9F6_9BACT|nr:hypothetical protein [Tichowtungia aerotolerans]QHI68708.1 hypothetical protein GT409_04350 [Tichowtungia aerotolerans]